MRQLNFFIIMTCMAIAWADVRSLTHDMMQQSKRGLMASQPYIFLTVPRGRSQSAENANIDGKSAIYEDFEDGNEDEEEEFDDDEENMTDSVQDNDDDEYSVDTSKSNMEDDENVHNNVEAEVENEDNEEEDNNELDNIMNKPYKISKSTHQHSPTSPMPTQIIEIEGRSVIDKNTGQPALLLPRAILNSIPDGSLVALMDRFSDDKSEGRANRVIIRRRRIPKRRPNTGNKRYRVVKRGGNKRLNNSQRKKVHVIRRGGNANRRCVNVRCIYL